MSNKYSFTKESLQEMSLDELKKLAKKYDVAVRGQCKADLAQSIYNMTIGAEITSNVILHGQW